MNFLKKIILVLIFLFPISNSFGAMVTLVDALAVSDGNDSDTDKEVSGIQFNADGTKMFVSFFKDNTTDVDYSYIDEYNLSTPYDISTGTYAGDSERCHLNTGSTSNPGHNPFDLHFSSDGMKFFFANRGVTNNQTDYDRIYGFKLTAPYDVSTCSYEQRTTDLIASDNIDNSNAGDAPHDNEKNIRAQGVSFSNDGKKMFTLIYYNTAAKVLEYNLSTPYDLTTISLNLNGGRDITVIGDGGGNPMAIAFNEKGTRFFVVDHNNKTVSQFSLSTPFSTSSSTYDGQITISTATYGTITQPRPIAFNNSGLKMYIGDDFSTGTDYDRVVEFDLACPFNIIAGKCPSITENSDRTGMAEAQVELAKRTINFSTNSVLNRLKWIRRNKDKQNLSNQNVKLNFSNSMFSPLKTLPISYFKKTSISKNKNDSNKNYFHWSEGSISLGRVGDTSIASTKEVNTNSLTFGFDKFTDHFSINGFAFRFGKDDVDVGSSGSNLDSNTYNITYYSTSPIKEDTRFVDKIFGIGKIKSDVLTVLDGKYLTADRTGHQIYGTLKIKDEYKKDNITLIPSGQFDFGHTILHSYKEEGTGAIDVKKQQVRTKKLRAAIALVEDLSNEKYTLKRHGKLEYVAEIDRSSNFKYTYVGDGSTSFNDTLHTGALHNINGEIGIDIVFPERYSLFIIYERNHAFGSGYTDNLYIALGYLPHEDSEFAFIINGSENLMSKFEIKKNINGYDLSFNLNDDLTNLGDNKEVSINLNKVF